MAQAQAWQLLQTVRFRKTAGGLGSIWLCAVLKGILSLSYSKGVQEHQIRQLLDKVCLNYLNIHGRVRVFSESINEAAAIQCALVFQATRAINYVTICCKDYYGCDLRGCYGR